MDFSLSYPPPLAPANRRRARGFTLVEVMMATFVMAIVISTSITAMQSGFRMIDTARRTTLAGQVLQSLVEDLRLQTWSVVNALPGTTTGHLSDFDTTSGRIQSGSFIGYSNPGAAFLNRFTVVRTVSDVPGQDGLKEIVFTATWVGAAGMSHTLSYTTYYARDGLYAFYTS